MRPLSLFSQPSLLLPVWASTALLSNLVYAQQGGDDKPSPSPSDSSSSEDEKPSPTPSKDTPSAKTTKATTTTPEDASSTSKGVSITNTGAIVTSADFSGIPSITGSSATGDFEFTDLPTLTGPAGAIPTYPPASVPPTKNAPFMQQSTLPDGTVFIAVGSILGAFGLAILLWRAIVSFLLHRSVARAALAQHDVNAKSGFPAPPAPFYKYTDHGSTMSLGGGAAAAGRGVRRTNRGPTPSANPSQSNLFFSPTAAPSNNGGNRASAFLPAGFYAAGSGSPAPQHGHSISLTNLRPDSRGHFGNASRSNLNPSPPESPRFSPRRDMSTSTLSLNLPPGQRAPSAYLDDLLADDPSSLPPPHMPPSVGPRGSTHSPGPNRV